MPATCQLKPGRISIAVRLSGAIADHANCNWLAMQLVASFQLTPPTLCQPAGTCNSTATIGWPKPFESTIFADCMRLVSSGGGIDGITGTAAAAAFAGATGTLAPPGTASGTGDGAAPCVQPAAAATSAAANPPRIPANMAAPHRAECPFAE